MTELTVELGDAIAFVALALSLWTWWARRRDAGRARFVARWIDAETILILNSGTASAHDVRIEFVTSSESETWKEKPVEITEVPPAQPVPLTQMPVTMVELVSVDVAWRDNRLRRQRMHLPMGTRPRQHITPAPRDSLEAQVQAIVRREIDAENRFQRRQDRR